MSETIDEARETCLRFAREHGLTFTERGEFIPDWSDGEAAAPRSIPYRDVLRALELDLSEIEKRGAALRASIASLQSLMDTEGGDPLPASRAATTEGGATSDAE